MSPINMLLNLPTWAYFRWEDEVASLNPPYDVGAWVRVRFITDKYFTVLYFHLPRLKHLTKAWHSYGRPKVKAVRNQN